MSSLCVFIFLTVYIFVAYGFTSRSECLIEQTQTIRHIGEHEADEEPEGPSQTLSIHHGPGMDDFKERMGHDEEEEEEGETRGHRGQGHGEEGASHLARPAGHLQGNGGRGYVDEEGELEDRRKRRHTADVLVGKLVCPTEEMIHILNVTVGYTFGQHCYETQQGCHAGSAKASQAMNCQGALGSCDISIQRNYLIRCERIVNFALVNYECVPANKRVNLCSKTDVDISGAVTLTSPNYPSAATGKLATGTLATCECTLRAEDGVRLEMQYLRTHMPGTIGHCEGDTLLLERPDVQGRYTLEHEICGHNSSNNVVTRDNILRVTLLGGSPLMETKSGFIAKFLALSTSGTATLFHISCTDSTSTTTDAKKLVTATGKSTSREQVEAKIAQARAQARAQEQGNIELTNNGENIATEKVDEGQSSPGVLPGVIASLASVIVIMGSVGGYIYHKRRQRRRLEKEELERYGTSFANNEHWYNTGSGHYDGRSKINQSRPLPDPYATYSLQNLLSKVVVLGRQLMNSRPTGAKSPDSNSDYSFTSDLVEIPPRSVSKSPCIKSKPAATITTASIHSECPHEKPSPLAPPRHKRAKLLPTNSDVQPYDNADASSPAEIVGVHHERSLNDFPEQVSASEDSAYSEDDSSSLNNGDGGYNNVEDDEHYTTIPEMQAAVKEGNSTYA